MGPQWMLNRVRGAQRLLLRAGGQLAARPKTLTPKGSLPAKAKASTPRAREALSRQAHGGESAKLGPAAVIWG